MLKFTVDHKETKTRARTGTIVTDRGNISTPQFMPVGTKASVKGVFPAELKDMGATVLLTNAFHLALRPGVETVENLGGVHKMMAWDRPILTDSGGFQVFSLAKFRTIDEDGVTFRSPLDGSLLRLTPESCVDLQRRLGSDFMMQLDVCPGGNAGREEVEAAVSQSLRWAQRCIDAHRKSQNSNNSRYQQYLLGIVQGAGFEDLRESSVKELLNMEFDAYAIGGLSVGESKDGMRRALEVTDQLLPENLPRYLMGVGHPLDLVDAIERGVDLFDCTLPTREGRNSRAYTSAGIVQIRNAIFADDATALDPECRGICCKEYSRGMIKHLFQANEMLGPILMSMHNLRFFLNFMDEARSAIRANAFTQFADTIRMKFKRKKTSKIIQ
ncbi:MAG: tRNA guanosine(34) transglycosylase Tgt [Planctomycetota bacterium]